MIRILVGCVLALSPLVPATAETITITCPDNNCTVTVSTCNGAIDLSVGCALPMFGGIP